MVRNLCAEGRDTVLSSILPARSRIWDNRPIVLLGKTFIRGIIDTICRQTESNMIEALRRLHPFDGGDDPFLEVPEEEGKFHIVGLALIPECQGEGRKFLGRNVCATLRVRVHV